jgi:putative OPT family oligopeptide transporter
VFKHYVRIIGVGGIAGAGIMGILAAFPSMIRSMRVGLSGLGHGVEGKGTALPRTDRSLPGKVVVTGLVTVLTGTFLFFSFGLGLTSAFLYAAAGTLLCGVIAFLFAPVSARAIAIVGTNPVSGMTMLTIIVTGLVMRQLGLEGGTGMFVVMLVGGVVCTSLASAGALASDLKVGHWIGATPRNQLALKFLGTLVAATFVGLAMWIMAHPASGLVMGSENLPAPQASAMKEILVGIMGQEAGELRWYLFGLGVILSVILRMAGVPALAFALGMYLPIQLNTPVLIGGILAWIVGRKREGEDPGRTKAGHSRGILIASGLIAGGALVGVFSGVLNILLPAAKDSLRLLTEHQLEGALGEWLSIGMLVALCAFLVIYARRAKADPDAPDLEGH